MFPTFIDILDIQSWWEVPSIAYFCSLFKTVFGLLDFDIEDLEEALLTDENTEEYLLQELIVKLLVGCLPDDTRNDISTFNYQMFLRRLFRKKCQEYKCKNPFNTDVNFELLPLRQKVEILQALCDFRLDAEDVEKSLINLDSSCLRVEPLGHDHKNSVYWYFYGTRLYREDYIGISDNNSYKYENKSKSRRSQQGWNKVVREKEKTKVEDNKRHSAHREKKEQVSVWQVVCFTQQDWSRLADKFRNSEYVTEQKLYHTLENFMPEIPKLFELKEKQQRRKLWRRNNLRINRGQELSDQMDDTAMVRSKNKTKISKPTRKTPKTAPRKAVILPPSPPILPQKKGRQTNNSLASAVGQIVIHTKDEIEDLQKKKCDNRYNTSQKSGTSSFQLENDELYTGMCKVIEFIKEQDDAWPFLSPVDEKYAPRYYSIIQNPMDIYMMDCKVGFGMYQSLNEFKEDMGLIVDNCRQYNGSDSEYTEMALSLKELFDSAIKRYILLSESSSDEEPPSPKSTSTFSAVANKKSKSSKMKHKVKLKTNSKDKTEEKRLNTNISKDKKNKKNKKKTNDRLVDNMEDEDEEDVVNEDEKKKKKKKSDNLKEMEIRKKSNIKDDDKSPRIGKQTTKVVENEKSSLKSKKKKSVENIPHSKNKKSSLNEKVIKVEVDKKINNSKNQQKNLSEIEIQAPTSENSEHLISVKNKSKKSGKRTLEDSEHEKSKAKKSKHVKIECHEEQDSEKITHSETSSNKVKKNQKKGKNESKNSNKCNIKMELKDESKKSEDVQEKEIKTHTKSSRVNGDFKDQKNSKDVSVRTAIVSKRKETCKKISTLECDKDLESLDSLKDRISERRREEEMRQEKEKQKKIIKHENHNVYSKKVPSNGNTIQDDKINVTRSKSKKSVKGVKTVSTDDSRKKQDSDIGEIKKNKNSQNKQVKHSKKEESSNIQALNQATEQTLQDINKWLDDAPRLSDFPTGGDSPMPSSTTTESNRSGTKVEHSRKRPNPMKIFGSNGPTKPKKIQRTIDRLQPGKSKGNLLLKKSIVQNANSNDTTTNQVNHDNEHPTKDSSDEPKLSLGTVLKNVDSIQLICKNIVASPNPNYSNDDDDEDNAIASSTPSTNINDNNFTSGKQTSNASSTSKIEVTNDDSTSSKPKSATPNLSAWFKAFGAPKSKKKEEDVDESLCKKGCETPEIPCSRQRKLSTGNSSISGSSLSHESSPTRQAKSPQNQPVPTTTESQIRGAGFYQDSLSTGGSPYNSPYYATPPRYSAQLPPTPSPQNHITQPTYSQSTAFDSSNLYSQVPATHQQPYPRSSPEDQSVETYRRLPTPTYDHQSPRNNFSQDTSPCDTYPSITNSQNQQNTYSQNSPLNQSYNQLSPQPTQSNYSQPSPQCKNSAASSPTVVAPAYSQPSSPTLSNYSQSPVHRDHSPYTLSSSPTIPNYSQPSPQQQHSPYAQPSPQQTTNYPQHSPQPISNYSQPHPTYSSSSQPVGISQSPSESHSHSYSQPSPQSIRSYPQTSPQENQTFSPTSSQQSLPNYPQHSPQSNTYDKSLSQSQINYSHPSPQQASNYPHQLHSPQQSPNNYPQISPRCITPTNYPQLSPQQQQPQPQQASNYIQPKTKDYPSSVSVSSNYNNESFKPTDHVTHVKSSITPSDDKTMKITESKSSSEQSKIVSAKSESPLNLNSNLQTYHSASSSSSLTNQYDTIYSSYSSNTIQRSATTPHTNLEQQQQLSTHQNRSNFIDLTDPMNNQKYVQQQRPSFHNKPETTNDHLLQQNQSQQLITFQPNLSVHESLYQSSFQPSYGVSNARAIYPAHHYFDSNAKAANIPGNSLPPIRKRLHNEESNDSTRTGQEQFGYDSIISLPKSDIVQPPMSQYDGTFVSNLPVDTSASNSAYARLGLNLVGRNVKDQQHLLTIPRPSVSKPEHGIAYSRTPVSCSTDLDLNLLQNIQNVSKNNQNILSMSRRETTSTSSSSTTRSKKGRKSKQQPQEQQMATSVEQQRNPNMPCFPQYATAGSEAMSLKGSSVVPTAASAFNFAVPTSTTSNSLYYEKEANSAAAAAFAFLDEFRNPNTYYNMLRQQQQQQQQQESEQHQQQQLASTVISETNQDNCNKLANQPPRNYHPPPPHPFLHSAQRATAYGPPVPTYVTPHGTNLAMDPAAYQQYIHSLYALQPPHHHRPSWL